MASIADIRKRNDVILKGDFIGAEAICLDEPTQNDCVNASGKVKKVIGDNDLFCNWQKGRVELKGDSLRMASKDRLKRIFKQIGKTFISGEREPNICTPTTGKDFKETKVCVAPDRCVLN